MNLHDIFPAVDIVEYSLYYLMLFCLMGVVILWYLLRYLIKHKKKTRSYYISLLEKSTRDDAKQLAHKVAYYGNRVVRTSEQKKKLEALLVELEPYKYKENLSKLETDTQKQLIDFLHTLRHKNV